MRSLKVMSLAVVVFLAFLGVCEAASTSIPPIAGFSSDQQQAERALEVSQRTALEALSYGQTADPSGSSPLVAGARNVSFAWTGIFSDVIGEPGGSWLRGAWVVNINASLEMERTGSSPEGWLTARYYSINSVSFEIPFAYETWRSDPPEYLFHRISGSSLLVLGNSDFDLHFDLASVIADPQWGCSYIVEAEGLMSGISIKHRQIRVKTTHQTVLRTPDGCSLAVRPGTELVGFVIVDEHTLEGENKSTGLWPGQSDFTVPDGYKDVRLTWARRLGGSYDGAGVLFRDADDEYRLPVGAVADGASRVIVEIQGVTSSADVTFPDGDGEWVTDPVLYDGVWRRVWQAPSEIGAVEGEEDSYAIRPIDFHATADGEELAPPPFYLYKPPVVLLHGLWGSPECMRSIEDALTSDGFLIIQNAAYPSEASFDDNAAVVTANAEAALEQAHSLLLVAKKVDIVGYSMGGVLAKLKGDSDYIRRVVTIGAPHYGSPVAKEACTNVLVRAILEGIGVSLDGAVQDLWPAPYCNVDGYSLGPDVPAMAVVGISYPLDELPTWWGDIYLTIMQILCFQMDRAMLYNRWFPGGELSDWVVSEPSQEGGLWSADVHHVTSTWHCAECDNATVIQHVLDFLNGPAEVGHGGFLSPMLPTYARANPAYTGQSFEPDGTVQFVSPATGSQIASGGSVRVGVSVPPGTTTVFAALPGSAVMDDSPPFEMDLSVPLHSLGAMPVVAVACDDMGILGVGRTDIEAVTAAAVESVMVWPRSVLHLAVGQSAQLAVSGNYSDGVTRNITASGTIFESSDPSVAVVDAAGNVMGFSPGYCILKISNGASADLPVMVRGDGGNPVPFAYILPSDGAAVTAETPPDFEFVVNSQVSSPYIQFSSSPSFPSKPAVRPDGQLDRALKFSIKKPATGWTPSLGQWKLMKRIVCLDNVLYWRLGGKMPPSGAVSGPVRSVVFQCGQVNDLFVNPSHLLDGHEAVWPDKGVLPEFGWVNGTMGMNYFYVDASTRESIPLGDKKSTVAMGGTGITGGSSYTATAAEWKNLRKLAAAGGGVLYWRVRAKDADKALTCASAAKKLVIDGGSLVLGPFDVDTSPCAATWSHTDKGLVTYKYYLQFSSDDSFDKREGWIVQMPGTGTLDTVFEVPEKLRAALVKKAQNPKSGTTAVYCRVRAENVDGAFVTYSNTVEVWP